MASDQGEIGPDLCQDDPQYFLLVEQRQLEEKPSLLAMNAAVLKFRMCRRKELIKHMKDFGQGGIKFLLVSDTAFRCQIIINMGTSK